jgi:hypothetical protein
MNIIFMTTLLTTISVVVAALAVWWIDKGADKDR